MISSERLAEIIGDYGESWDESERAISRDTIQALREYAALREAVREARCLLALASQEWQERDGSRRGATDNSGARMWFISDEVMRSLRSLAALGDGK